MVIRAALDEAHAHNAPVLIEATCNQVNQDGGYTGMTPESFITFVQGIAKKAGFDSGRILFGGDHLGPNPWRHLPADAAMEKAQVMIAAYARAGFAKLHLDASMACADDPEPLPPETIAARAARLARVAEAAAREAGRPAPGYIIGTEVPVPGGATHALSAITPTAAADTTKTLHLHQSAFSAVGLEEAFGRVVGLVVQPGVEFGHSDVIRFDAAAAQGLTDWRNRQGALVFEAHSTDYQSPAALRALVEGGFAILKVGPALTFALREALYALDQIAGHLCGGYHAGSLPATMEKIMLEEPGNWRAYYSEAPAEAMFQRHFSYSDRIRYYWGHDQAQKAVLALMQALGERAIPETLVSQYLARCYDQVAQGQAGATAPDLVRAHIRLAIAPYSSACTERER